MPGRGVAAASLLDECRGRFGKTGSARLARRVTRQNRRPPAEVSPRDRGPERVEARLVVVAVADERRAPDGFRRIPSEALPEKRDGARRFVRPFERDVEMDARYGRACAERACIRAHVPDDVAVDSFVLADV